MTVRDRLLKIKATEQAPGKIFYGEISDNGVVSQDVTDASGDFKWLIKQAEKVERYEKVLNYINELAEEFYVEGENEVFYIPDNPKVDSQHYKKYL